eukprot:164288-Chlamydomonas_euryale.AAC.1
MASYRHNYVQSSAATSQSLQRAPLTRLKPGFTALPGYRPQTRKGRPGHTLPTLSDLWPCDLCITARQPEKGVVARQPEKGIMARNLRK